MTFTKGYTAPVGRNIGETWSVVIVAVLIALFLQVVYLARYDFNPAALVGMPEWLAAAAGDVPRNIPRFLTGGHDGGYIYLFAREPFPPRIDLVSIHVERPLFPLLAWFLALGQPEYVVYTPQILNLLATALIAAVCAIALRSRGIDYRWAVVCALGPGLAMPLRFNLVDQFVLAWLVTGFLMFDRRRHGMAALCLSLAILARPMSLGAAGVAALVSAFTTEDRRSAFWYVLCPVPYFVWRMYLQIEAGYPVSFFTGDELFTAAPLGFLGAVENLTRQLSAPRLALFTGGVMFYVLIAVATIRHGWRVRLLGYESLLILGYTAAVLALPQTMGAGPVQMARLTPIFPFVLYLFAGESAAEARVVTGAVVGMSLFGSLWWLAAPTMI